MCSGTPSASAQWMWPKVGGLATMTSAMNGFSSGSYGSGAVHAGHSECTIALSIASFAGCTFFISPITVPPDSTIQRERTRGSPASG